MVGPGPAASAAAEERWQKLQEYLAAKGKLKDPNTKPYLKAKNICPKPPSSKYTPGPKKDVSNHVVLPGKTTKPINIKLQAKPANITGSQKPESMPPKLPSKGLTPRCFPSNSDYKQSSKPQQQHKTVPSTAGLSRKPRQSPDTQELKAKQQQEARGTAKCTDPVADTHAEKQSLDGFLDETNKENLPRTLLKPKKPDSDLHSIRKPKTGSSNQTQRSLAPKQISSKSSVTHTALKDRANTQLIRNTQTRAQPGKSQRLPTADSSRPRGKPSQTAPSYSVSAHYKTQTLKKPVIKNTQDIMVNRVRSGRPNETKVQPCPATEQRVKHTKPSSHLSVLQGGHNSRHLNMQQDQKPVQPCLGPRTSCILQKSRAISQRPNLMTGDFNSVIPSTPNIRANKTLNSKYSSTFQQKAQTVDSKFKRFPPQSHFLNKTAPRTQASTTAASRKGAPSVTQTHPHVKKPEGEDRRKQLEEWQKSKGKTYKRPPMIFKTRRKVIEEMNTSFWKSIEREEEEKTAQLELSRKINSTLTECLRLIEEGVLPNEIFTVVSSIPEAEKFAKFWVCKAKLLASKGPFDALGLYEEAIQNGAAPIQELQEVLNILQDTSRSAEVTSDSSAAGTNTTSAEELAKEDDSEQPCPPLIERERAPAAPRIPMVEWDNPGIKLQVAPIPRICGMPEVQDMKLITPVRRSARIERTLASYPEMLQERDIVVASLNELLEVDNTECFVFRENEALPVTLGFEILES
ncbi:rCG26481 [Rattus norvegicus]|uniref:RCG26481 n=1 Tax=Rattus norvegicus TaxID=10116 RepID=A6HQ58_RAT|nr:cytoskeleton-associated protein 2-like isoform X2 [Rattus norvegicus]EDL80159.1 rCG26481 [Rattus norvegicus]|eukprot:XP_006235057.1 PREDICTED: cytoskeleton-associated protein 2-like isoform X2 [Rattus norvegicus]